MISKKIDQAIIDKVLIRVSENRYAGHKTNHGRAWGLAIEETMFSIFHNLRQDNTYEFDATFFGFKIDIKGELRVGPPKPFYDASISTNQKPDFFLFGHLAGTKGEHFNGLAESEIVKSLIDKNVYVLGLIAAKTFNDEASLFRAGQIQPSSNDYKFETDTKILPYFHLRDGSCLNAISKENFKNDYRLENNFKQFLSKNW